MGPVEVLGSHAHQRHPGTELLCGSHAGVSGPRWRGAWQRRCQDTPSSQLCRGRRSWQGPSGLFCICKAHIQAMRVLRVGLVLQSRARAWALREVWGDGVPHSHATSLVRAGCSTSPHLGVLVSFSAHFTCSVPPCTLPLQELAKGAIHPTCAGHWEWWWLSSDCPPHHSTPKQSFP